MNGILFLKLGKKLDEERDKQWAAAHVCAGRVMGMGIITNNNCLVIKVMGAYGNFWLYFLKKNSN